jgi:protein TonB
VIIKFRIVSLFLLVSSTLNAQELVQTDYEKGYVKDGKRYSVWQYFNSNKEVELTINHTTGRVMYVIPDTSSYVIFRNGEWVSSKLDVHPIPVTGYRNFYQAISDTLKYPRKDFKNGLEGKVIITFDVDTLGITTNYNIVKNIGGSCDSAVLSAFKARDQKWIPARAGKKRYPARFAIGLEFRLNKNQSPLEHEDFKVDSKRSKLLEEFVVKTPINGDDSKVLTFVEKSAEPVGGLEGFYKWVGRSLRYPVDARRMGIQGKVFVKFIIEMDGAITNVELVAGFGNIEINQEAIRIISIMPKWIPGTQSGRPIRQTYTLPIAFKLAE